MWYCGCMAVFSKCGITRVGIFPCEQPKIWNVSTRSHLLCYYNSTISRGTAQSFLVKLQHLIMWPRRERFRIPGFVLVGRTIIRLRVGGFEMLYSQQPSCGLRSGKKYRGDLMGDLTRSMSAISYGERQRF